MINKESDFNFFLPINLGDDVLKSVKNKKGEARYKNMVVEGIASDMSEDFDEEILDPNGFELSRFLRYGWINYDHRAKDNPKFNVGEPISAKIINNKLHVKGKLFKGNSLSRDVFDTMIMLENSDTKRRMGWSIEGKALERDLQNPKRIKKALITNIALTPSPINHNTFANIVKGHYSSPIVENYEYDNLQKSNEAANRGQITYLVDITNYETGIRYTIDKNLHLKVEKAISTETAEPLIREDLERKLKVLPFGDVKAALVNVSKANRDGKIKKSLFDEIKRNIDIYKKYL